MPQTVSPLATIPRGLIAMWHGTIADIPVGWVICDGNNGTPNLLSKFVMGVATAATDPGATGGESTHTLTEAEMPAHIHTVKWGNQVGTGVSTAYAVNGGTSTANTESTGGGGAHENKPPYYAVAYIMKV